MRKPRLLDSYAILAWLLDETGADKVDKLLEEAKEKHLKVLMSWINVGEVYYRIIRRKGRQIADETLIELQTLPIGFLSITNELVLEAARIKAEHSISYADCFAVATAIDQKASVVTGDPEFEKVEKLVDIDWINHGQ